MALPALRIASTRSDQPCVRGGSLGTKPAASPKLARGGAGGEGHSFLVSGTPSDYTRHLNVLTK